MPFSIAPSSGSMCSLLFENEHIGLNMTHFLNITVRLQPIEFKSEIHSSEIQLDFIEVPFRRFSDIENRAFSFPINPDDGYIDGSVYLFEDHIPVDVTQIVFGQFEEESIHAEITGKVKFSAGGYDISNQPFEIRIDLKFQYIFIPPDILEPVETKLIEARKLLEGFFELSELKAPVITNNGFQDVIVFEKAGKG